MKNAIAQRALMSALTLAAFSAANAQLFDFEGEVATGSNSGGYSTLTMVNGAQTLTITRVGGTAFDVVENTGSQAGKPANWGMNSLSPFFDYTGGAFICDFAVGINSFSVDVGDYVPSDDDEVTLSAYTGAGGTGTFLGSITDTLPGDSPTFDFKAITMSFGGSPAAMSIVMSGGSGGFPQSLFWDNINVSTVPEPTTFAVLGLGALALRRKRK